MLMRQWVVSSLIILSSCSLAGQSPSAQPSETRKPVTVRSPYSTGADLAVPLCAARFHDSLKSDRIASANEPGVTAAKTKRTVPAKMTIQAIDAAGKTHIGNFLVITNAVVDANGNPQNICLEKSSGYGLDASAVAAVGQYRFEPAKKEGKPVPMRVAVEVRFVSPVPPPIGQPRLAQPPK